jgi:hypothetical protein
VIHGKGSGGRPGTVAPTKKDFNRIAEYWELFFILYWVNIDIVKHALLLFMRTGKKG